jgi:hypothetical protein
VVRADSMPIRTPADFWLLVVVGFSGGGGTGLEGLELEGRREGGDRGGRFGWIAVETWRWWMRWLKGVGDYFSG